MKNNQNDRPLQRLYQHYLQQIKQRLGKPLTLHEAVSALAEGVSRVSCARIYSWDEPSITHMTSIIRIQAGSEAIELHHLQEASEKGTRSKKYLYIYEGATHELKYLPGNSDVPQSTLFLLSAAEHIFLRDSETTIAAEMEAAPTPEPTSQDQQPVGQYPLYDAFSAMVEGYRKAGKDLLAYYYNIKAMNEAMDAIPGATMQEWEKRDSLQQVTVVRITAGLEVVETHHCFLKKGAKPVIKKYRYYQAGKLIEKASFAFSEKEANDIMAFCHRLFAEEKFKKAS